MEDNNKKLPPAALEPTSSSSTTNKFKVGDKVTRVFGNDEFCQGEIIEVDDVNKTYRVQWEEEVYSFKEGNDKLDSASAASSNSASGQTVRKLSHLEEDRNFYLQVEIIKRDLLLVVADSLFILPDH